MKEHMDSHYRDIFAEMDEAANAIVLCGDLTDSGSPKEAERLVTELAGVKAPIVGVLGNHDHHCGKVAEIRKILTDGKVMLLEEQAYDVSEVGFAGVKGFGGGFGRYMLSAFGEPMMKQFAEESVRESMKLETELQKLNTKYKVVVLHYAPAPSTVHGEPPEIYPFLGSSRLGEVIQRFDVQVVVHGHAHFGTFEGAFPGGTRIYNCAQDVVRRQQGKPYALISISP